MRKLAALLMLLMMTATTALADMAWPRLTTAGQELLQGYVTRVNENLTYQGRATINSIFELYETFVTMGVTSQDNAELPEDVELTFLLGAEGLGSLQIRVSDAAKFAPIAAACIQASSPTAIMLETALAEANSYVQRTLNAPYTAFEDEVNFLQGPSPRLYYAYYPNQYNDGLDWRQVTLIFPLPGSVDAPFIVASDPDDLPGLDQNELYSMNTRTFEEGYDHLEIFVTPTPEPDSAANLPY